MPPLLVLLLPRPLEDFILRDQAADLLAAPGAVALEPGRMPYGVLGRLRPGVAARLARRTARRLRLAGTPRAVVLFHPFQLPLAEAIADRAGADCELWYWRWDAYEHAYDASPSDQSRLAALDVRARARAALVVAVNPALAGDVVVPLAADSFPAPDPGDTVVAVSLGHLGRRTDWSLLRALGERMPGLVLLLVGTWHDNECRNDDDYAWCRAHPGFVWLGRRDDDEAARIILAATVGIVAFERSPFNETALPYRILKYARLGRPTVAPPLAGLEPWSRAVRTATTPGEWEDALRAARPDPGLRAWALAQTARAVDAPLFARMEELGISSGRADSGRTH